MWVPGEGAHPPPPRSPRPPGAAAAGAAPQTGNLSWVFKYLQITTCRREGDELLGTAVPGVREVLHTQEETPKPTEFALSWRQRRSFLSLLAALPGGVLGCGCRAETWRLRGTRGHWGVPKPPAAFAAAPWGAQHPPSAPGAAGRGGHGVPSPSRGIPESSAGSSPARKALPEGGGLKNRGCAGCAEAGCHPKAKYCPGVMHRPRLNMALG